MGVSKPDVTRDDLERRIDQAMGRTKADLVIKNTRFLNVVTGEIAEGDIAVCGDVIVGTYESYDGDTVIDGRDRIAVPGFIDTHVHCESTLVSPFEFDRCVLPRGTTTAICDPHEICNVLGEEGLQYFLDSSVGLAMDLRVQLSSCVPATELETSGARLEAADLVRHRGHPQVIGLAEFMNFPGVLHKDPGVLDKLAAFQGGHIDGHSPLVSGYDLNAYLSCGIKNCHETTGVEEAREKLRKGMQVLIRDGSVSKDVNTLAPIIDAMTSPFLGFCTDDRNPLDIAEEGHIDHLIRRSIALGAPVESVYRAATWSAARGFGLTDRGLIAPGFRADIVLLDDLADCRVNSVIRSGRLVGPESFEGRPTVAAVGLNSLKLDQVTPDIFRVASNGPTGPVIGLIPGKILTEHLTESLPYRNGERHPDPEADILKVCVLSRHGTNRNVGRGFVKGFGLKRGALASSVGHDSHNVIVVGADDADMAVAVNRLIELQGGFVSVLDGNVTGELALPLAGLISDRSFEEVEHQLIASRAAVRAMGCPLAEPFLQLAFLPLPVIPHLKITDMGLVDVDRFELIPA
ncbi:adenine deaminase 1 [Skermanella aerolata]|uniref:Adenine deaminase n=1 Tax=Skermanella aerolata TaxID=393310 RepID=A0A512DM54_9PROT|nr:adenine deaminase [Skermanella aerolata]GEO37549.1 adenine deaminase 1 [Skermanella aerolata]